MFNREIGNAPPRIEAIWRRKSGGRTNVETSAAGGAAIWVGRNRREIKRCEERTEKKPGPELAGHQIRMFALPSKAALSSKRFFHNRGCIDEYFHRAASVGRQPACQPFQAHSDNIVIVVASGVDRNSCVVAHL